MTEKRFTVYKTIGMLHCFYVNDDLTDKVVIDQILHKYEADRLCKKLNELHEENEQLKQAYTQLKHRHSLLHDVCIDAECDRDSYRKDVVSLEKGNANRVGKLKKENEQLKKQNQELNDELQKTMGYLALKSSVEKENEQLQQELDSFKPVMFQDMRKGTVLLYTKRYGDDEND